MPRRIWALHLFIFIGLVLVFANWPEPRLDTNITADRIVVEKSKRTLTLMKEGKALKVYKISLGRNPAGKKQREGDGKTPTGSYFIDYRNPNSSFYKSLHISYPAPEDIAQAKEKAVAPGGMIMIHGLRNGFGFLG